MINKNKIIKINGKKKVYVLNVVQSHIKYFIITVAGCIIIIIHLMVFRVTGYMFIWKIIFRWIWVLFIPSKLLLMKSNEKKIIIKIFKSHIKNIPNDYCLFTVVTYNMSTYIQSSPPQYIISYHMKTKNINGGFSFGCLFLP